MFKVYINKACSCCGIVTGTIKISVQEYGKPERVEYRCSFCSPELFSDDFYSVAKDNDNV